MKHRPDERAPSLAFDPAQGPPGFPLTERRAREAHHGELATRSELARLVIGALLYRYAENGIDDVTYGEALRLPPVDHLGSPVEIAAAFGGPAGFHGHVDELLRWLYAAQFIVRGVDAGRLQSGT